MTRQNAALIAAGAALWLAALAAWRLAPDVDLRLLALIETSHGSAVARIATAVTLLGEFPFLIAATALAAAWLAVRYEVPAAIWLLAVTLGGRAATAVEKDVFLRERPPLAHRIVEATSAAFPSAHAFNTMLVGLAIAAALRGGGRAVIPAVVFSLAVGATRPVLGVHWPSDVVAGWGSALAWAAMWRPLLRWRQRSPRLTAGSDSWIVRVVPALRRLK